MATTTLPAFHHFPELPPELRLKIWALAVLGFVFRPCHSNQQKNKLYPLPGQSEELTMANRESWKETARLDRRPPMALMEPNSSWSRKHSLPYCIAYIPSKDIMYRRCQFDSDRLSPNGMAIFTCDVVILLLGDQFLFLIVKEMKRKYRTSRLEPTLCHQAQLLDSYITKDTIWRAIGSRLEGTAEGHSITSRIQKCLGVYFAKGKLIEKIPKGPQVTFQHIREIKEEIKLILEDVKPMNRISFAKIEDAMDRGRPAKSLTRDARFDLVDTKSRMVFEFPTFKRRKVLLLF